MPAKRPAPRLAPLKEENLDAAQRALLESLRAGPRGRSLNIRGPFAAWMYAPEFGTLAQALGAHTRYKTRLEPRLSEFAILCTARFWKAQYEWFAHAPIAQKAGLSPDIIAELKTGKRPSNMPEEEAVVYDFVTELTITRKVTDETFARAQKVFSEQQIVDLTAVAGNYVMVAMMLAMAEQTVPPGKQEPFRPEDP